MTPRNAFSPGSTQLVGHLGEDSALEDAEDAFGTDDVRKVRGMPPVRPTERL
jgi:hypothetical protein